MFRALLILLTLSVAARQLPEPRKAATVDGDVVNMATAEGLADARITFTSAGTASPAVSATTDANGHFSVAGLDPGRYTVSATRALFFRPKRNAGPVNLTVAAEEHVRDLRIQLAPAGAIAGRVSDANRQALRSLRVEALRYEYRDGLRIMNVAGHAAQTDDRGEYRIFNLEPGVYYVRVSSSSSNASSGAPPSAGSSAALSIPFYYPGVLDPVGAAPVQVESGRDQSAIDVRLTPVRIVSIQLKVIFGGVENPQLAPVFTVTRRGPVQDPIPTQSQHLNAGVYRVGPFASGPYEIFIRTNPSVAGASGRLAFDVTEASEPEIDVGTVSVRSNLKLGGVVQLPVPLPANPKEEPARISVRLRAIDGAPYIARSSALAAPVGTRNAFTIPNVPAGTRFRLDLTGLPSDTFLESAHYGGRDVLDSGLTVANELEGPLELSVVRGDALGSVSGVVRNRKEEPVADAIALLIPPPQRRVNPAAFVVASTDQFGAFSMRGIPPGEYRVLAWEDIKPEAYLDPEFLKDIEKQGENVTVERGSWSIVSAHVIP